LGSYPEEMCGALSVERQTDSRCATRLAAEEVTVLVTEGGRRALLPLWATAAPTLVLVRKAVKFFIL
jgi:hypothetical protein